MVAQSHCSILLILTISFAFCDIRAEATHLLTANSTTKSQAGGFECPTKMGYYVAATGTHTNKYWLCVDYEAHEFACPRGTHFNVHENKCTEWIDENSSDWEQHPHEKRKLAHQKTTHHTRRHHHHPHRNGHLVERLHRRIDELDSRLDQLYAYVDSKLRQSGPQATH